MNTKSTLKPLLLPCVVAVALAMSACGSKTIHKPNPLPKLAQVQKLSPVFHASLGAAEKYDPLRLEPDAVGDTIYAVSHDGEVAAYTLQGKRLWEKRPSKKEKDITSGVTVSDGVAIVGSGMGVLYALDATTGDIKWKRQLSGSILAPSLIHGNRVITLSNDGTAYGTDLTTGQPVWTFDLSTAQLSMRGYAAPVMADDDTVLLASSGAYIYGLNVETGVPRWQRRVAVSDGRSEAQRLIDVDGDPVVNNGELFTVSYQGQLTAIDLNTQRVLWSQDSSSLRNVAVGNGLVYVATTTGNVQAYNQATGEPAWTQDALAYRNLSNPALLGQYLVVGDADGYLHLLDPATGKVVGRVDTSGAVRVIRVIDNRLYVESRTGRLSVWQAP